MAAPFAMGFHPAGTIVAVALGTVLVGLALSAAAEDPGGLPVGAHATFDHGLALGGLGAAVGLAVAGDLTAAPVLTVAGGCQLALAATTRYTAPRRR